MATATAAATKSPLYIHGEFRPSKASDWIEVRDPVINRAIGKHHHEEIAPRSHTDGTSQTAIGHAGRRHAGAQNHRGGAAAGRPVRAGRVRQVEEHDDPHAPENHAGSAAAGQEPHGTRDMMRRMIYTLRLTRFRNLHLEQTIGRDCKEHHAGAGQDVCGCQGGRVARLAYVVVTACRGFQLLT